MTLILKKIMDLPYRADRMRELLLMARGLGIPEPRLKMYGEGDKEEALVILIYDTLKSHADRRRKNLRFIALIMVGAAVIIAGLFLVPATFRYRKVIDVAEEERKETVYTGITAAGDEVQDEKARPVLFRAMSGTYIEDDEEGNTLFEYLYEDGRMVKKKKYARDGNVESEIEFNEDGDPILKTFK